MPTRTYSRKTGPQGNPADPTRGDPSFSEGILTALPGRTWRTDAGANVSLDIDGGDLTQQEEDDLTAAHTAWTPTSQTAYAPNFEVTTTTRGNVTKVEWFETDNGDGTYSGLAKDAVYAWTLGTSVLISITTTRYAKDGSVIGDPVVEEFYTTSAGTRVKKVT